MNNYSRIYIEIGSKLTYNEIDNFYDLFKSKLVKIEFLKKSSINDHLIKVYIKQDNLSLKEYLFDKYLDNKDKSNLSFKKNGYSLELVIFYINKEILIDFKNVLFQKINDTLDYLNDDSIKSSIFMLNIEDLLKTNIYVKNEEMKHYLQNKIIENNIDYQFFENNDILFNYFEILFKSLINYVPKICEENFEYLNKRNNSNFIFSDEFKNLSEGKRDVILILNSIPDLTYYKSFAIANKFENIHELIEYLDNNSDLNVISNLKYLNIKNNTNKNIGPSTSTLLYKFFISKTPDITLK